MSRTVGGVLLVAACQASLPQDDLGDTDVAPSTVASRHRDAVLAYLTSQHGQAIVSGQMDLAWTPEIDMVGRVEATTGRAPALCGFDFMDFTSQGQTHADADGQTTEALAWWADARGSGQNGLVAFNWHWQDPSGATTSFHRLADVHIPLKDGAFDPATPLGVKMTADMDFVAEQLAVLRDAGVPVLWRPLHEAGGLGVGNGVTAWFWWGQDGSAAYIALYRYMHARFTDEHGLDNLIWVWNGQDPTYWPGGDVVDVGGEDVYDKDHTSQVDVYDRLRDVSGDKLVALTEVGAIPDPDALVRDGAWFSWFMVWNDNPNLDLAHAADNFWSGSGSTTEDAVNYPWNTPTFERAVYAHDRVITLDELPRFVE